MKVVNSETGKVTVLRRPIQHLLLLELHLDPDRNSDSPNDQPNDDTQRNYEEVLKEMGHRPRREAAKRGEIARRNQKK